MKHLSLSCPPLFWNPSTIQTLNPTLITLDIYPLTLTLSTPPSCVPPPSYPPLTLRASALVLSHATTPASNHFPTTGTSHPSSKQDTSE